MSELRQNIEIAGTAIEDYLRGCVGYSVTAEAINTILIDRGINPGTDVSGLDKKQKELCRADLYMWCASGNPSITASVEDANGVWRHKEGSTQSLPSDKRELRRMANDIYAMYGEKRIGSTIRIDNYGMSMIKKKPL